MKKATIRIRRGSPDRDVKPVQVYASMYATPKQIDQLLSWGANPNFLDPEWIRDRAIGCFIGAWARERRKWRQMKGTRRN